MNRITIIVVDDHAIICEGLKELLSAQADMEVVGVARCGEEAIEKARILRPDIMILDITMPGMSGLDVVGLLKEAIPETKIIIFTMHNKDIYVEQAVNAGVMGYVLKTSPSSEVSAAIRTVFNGGHFLAPEVKDELVKNYFERQTVKPRTGNYDSLSKREQVVFRLMVEGKSTKEMAGFLCLSSKTVEKYRSSAMRKLGLCNLVEATKYAVRIGIVTTDVD
jgi:two-component system response regulator NreC